MLCQLCSVSSRGSVGKPNGKRRGERKVCFIGVIKTSLRKEVFLE